MQYPPLSVNHPDHRDLRQSGRVPNPAGADHRFARLLITIS